MPVSATRPAMMPPPETMNLAMNRLTARNGMTRAIGAVVAAAPGGTRRSPWLPGNPAALAPSPTARVANWTPAGRTTVTMGAVRRRRSLRLPKRQVAHRPRNRLPPNPPNLASRAVVPVTKTKAASSSSTGVRTVLTALSGKRKAEGGIAGNGALKALVPAVAGRSRRRSNPIRRKRPPNRSGNAPVGPSSPTR